MVHIPNSYNLDREQVDSLVLALEGNVVERARHIAELKKWQTRQDIQMSIYNHTKDWLMEYGKKVGWDKMYGYDEGWCTTPEEFLEDNVLYRMSYTPFLWNEKENKIEITKYTNSGMFSKEMKEQMLTYLNEKVKL